MTPKNSSIATDSNGLLKPPLLAWLVPKAFASAARLRVVPAWVRKSGQKSVIRWLRFLPSVSLLLM